MLSDLYVKNKVFLSVQKIRVNLKLKIDFFRMNSIDNKCNELKWNYDSCFYSWLDDYIGNKRAYPEGYVPCEAQFKPYQACVVAALDANNIKLTQTAQVCFKL